MLEYDGIKHRGTVAMEPIVKNSDSYVTVEVGQCEEDGNIIKWLNREVDNIKLVCKKNIDDSRYVFKLDFIEEKDKDEPLILVRRNEDTNRFYYTFHIIPEFTKDVVSGKYWVTVELYVHGEKLTLYPSITEIVDNGADAFGGQVRAFAGDIPYYDDEEF